MTTTQSGKPLIAWDDAVAKRRPGQRAGQRRPDPLGHALRRPTAPTPRCRRPRAVGPGGRAKTSNKTTTARGGSCREWPRTGSSRRSTPRPATCTSPDRSTATATRRTSPSSPRPGWSRPGPHPGQRLGRQDGDGVVGDEPDGLEILADSAYGSGETRAHFRARGHRQLIKPIRLRGPSPAASPVTTSPLTAGCARSPVPPGSLRHLP